MTLQVCQPPGPAGGIAAAADASSLDTLETCDLDDGPAILPEWSRLNDCLDSWPWEHRGWAPIRRRVYSALMTTEAPAARVHRFTHCGDEVHVYQNSETGEIDYRSSHCRDRWCLICGQARSRRIAAALREKIGERPAFFITLTLRGQPGDQLAEMLERLKKGWKTLKKSEFWREHVDGGALMLEVKWAAGGGGHWHPHHHILAHGTPPNQDRMRALWYSITGDSFMCDVRAVNDVDHAVHYVTKYASKPLDMSFMRRPTELAEAMLALKGVRMCACFGTWFGTPLNEEPPGEEATEVLTSWVYRGTTGSLRHRAAAGDQAAAALAAAVERLQRIRSLRDHRPRSTPAVRDATGPPDASP